MTEHGWDTDEWPAIFPWVLAADLLVVAGPIWLGDNFSVTKRIIERLYAHSGELNDQGQWVYYRRVGGALVTGNEDGIKLHLASMLKRNRGIPAHGNQRAEWDAGARFDFENPEYR